MEIDIKSFGSSGVVVLVLNGGGCVIRSLGLNDFFICIFEGGFGFVRVRYVLCDAVRLSYVF